jgi:Aminoglycoside-2''-adenylyltransferase
LGVIELSRLLREVPVRWWLSGGWAIDEFVAAGQATRDHGDIDVSVPRQDWPALRRGLGDRFQLRVAAAGRLDRLATELVQPGVWNISARDRAGGPWRMQINLEEAAGDRWIYRRDPRISRPLSELRWWSGRTWCGAPAVQLLWNAKAPSAKDEHDWTITVPKLPVDERVWLGRAIAIAHSQSAWATRLAQP